MRKCEKLVEDEEFKRICPGKGAGKKDLSEDTGKRGSNLPVIETWQHIILFDYDTYYYCKKYNIHFRIVEHSFNSRAEAIYYTAKHHFENPQIDQLHRRYCIGKCYNAMKIIGKQNYTITMETFFPELKQKIQVGSTKNSKTAILASQIFHVCQGSASLYGVWANAIDTIAMKSPSTAEKIFDGDIYYSLDKTIALSKYSGEEILFAEKHPEIVRTTTSRTHNRSCTFNFSGMRKDLSNNKSSNKVVTSSNEQQFRKHVDSPRFMPAIKQMPEYDPDAELNSLALTVPMWAGSIERTMKHADFSSTSQEGRKRLEEKLSILKSAIANIENLMEENDDE